MRFLLIACVIFGSLVAGAKDFSIDKAHSSVGFKVKHLTITNVNGSFANYDAVIDYDEKSATFKKFQANIQVASVNSGNQTRDDQIRGDEFLNAKSNPEMSFVMKEYQKISANQGKMKGTLRINGVQKEVVLDVEIAGVAEMRGKKKVGFSVGGEINRLDFHVAPEKPDALIGNKVILLAEVEADER